MVQFRCESSNVEKKLFEIHQQAIEQGAYFHPNMVVASTQNELGVACRSDTAQGGQLMRIPESCFPPIEKFDLSIVNDEICINSHDKDVEKSHIQSLEHSASLYNITGKIRQHRGSSFWFALNDQPSFVNYLTSGRGGAKKIEYFLNLYNSRDMENLLLRSFLNTRSFHLNSSHSGNKGPVLLSLIDLCNHSFNARPFQELNNESSGLSEIAVDISHSIGGSDECFVRYGILDSLDTFLVYDFVDESAPFVRSVPLEVRLSCGVTLKAASQIGASAKAPLPPALQDLRGYMPGVVHRRDNHVEVTYLMIPGRLARNALRRVLASLIGLGSPELTQTSMRDAVQEAEAAILAANRKYYESLSSRIRELSDAQSAVATLDTLKRAVSTQLAKIEDYQGLEKDLLPV